MQYKTVIFDLGKVIFDYSWDHMYKYFGDLANLDPQEVQDRIFVGGDTVFEDFERGLVTPEAYREYVEKLLGVSLTIPQFADGLNSIYEEAYAGIEEILGGLELKYLLVALTNTNPIHATDWRERYTEQLQYFSYIFCSHEMHSRKPEAIIYEQVLRSTGSLPQECVFFDDRLDNVEGARAVGITAEQVTSPEEIRAVIAKLGL